MNVEIAKENMIKQQVQSLGVGYGRLLDAIIDTPRENFMPQDMAEVAYSEVEIPLNHAQKTLSMHTITKALKALDVKKTDRVLQIGCGSGYLTALLAKLSQMVETCDFHLDFVNHTKHKLKSIGIYNVKYHQGDALSEAALAMFEGSYDIIFITPKVNGLPQQYIEKLNAGGKLIYFLQKETYAKAVLVHKLQEDKYQSKPVFDVYDEKIEQKQAKSSDAFAF